MSDGEKNKRKVWSVMETKGLLKCYLARQDEFLHMRKKRNAFTRVLEDMVDQGFTDAATTPASLEGKMRTLTEAYEKRRHDPKLIVNSPTIAPYLKIMNQIYENKRKRKVRVGSGAYKTRNDNVKQTNAIPTNVSFKKDKDEDVDESEDEDENEDDSEDEDSSDNPLSLVKKHSLNMGRGPSRLFQDAPKQPSANEFILPTTVPVTKKELQTSKPTTEKNPQTPTPTATSARPLSPDSNPSISRRRRKTARESYYEKKLELKKTIAERKMAAKDKFHRTLLKLVDRNDREKLMLLKDFLSKR